MKFLKKKNKKTIKKRYPLWLVLLAIFFIIIITISVFLFGYQKTYAQKIYPGVKVDDIELTGKTMQGAERILKDFTDDIYKYGFIYSYKDKKVIISPVVTSPTDPDISRQILSFNNQKTARQAFAIGHKKNFFLNLKEAVFALFKENNIKLNYELNAEEFENILKENFQELEKPGQNAQISINFTSEEEDNTDAENYEIKIIPEKIGSAFDYQKAVEDTKNHIENLQNKPIEMDLITDYPYIKAEQTDNAVEQIDPLLELSPLTLKYKEESWEIGKKTLADLLEFQSENQEIGLGLNREKTLNQLEKIAQEINIPAKDAKFEIKNGKAAQFQNSQEGLELDLEKNYEIINYQFTKENKNEIELTVKKTLPQIATSNTNDLGIEELIGVGESDFSGSPANRRHNIKIGADTLNGLLVKPDEEFSLVNSLGDIDASTGYLPELVIKGNKTIPEYGGGLCQIGTTTFRAALDTGLPITERRPHSYRVSYYEPAGTDATIYIPHPDLRFINDTGNYILIQTKIEGNKLIFEFWGTPDGREVEITEPKIFNFVAPGPTKIIKTEDLEPGKKRCTERAHTGADAEFTRTITYANGEVEEEKWTSHYQPWREVCLVGVEELEEEGEEEENSGEENENNNEEDEEEDNEDNQENNSENNQEAQDENQEEGENSEQN